MNLPAPLLAIDGFYPKKQRLSRFSDSARVTFRVTNRDDMAARFRLEGSDEPGVCHFEFQAPGEMAAQSRQAELFIAPNETVSIPIRIILPPNQSFGLKTAVHRFTIAMTSPGPGHGTRAVIGEIARPPLLGAWLLSLGAMGLILVGILSIQLGFWPQTEEAPSRQIAVEPEAGEQTAAFEQALLSQAILSAQARPPVETRPELETEISMEQIFREVGSRYNLDWRLLAEVAYQESRMNPWAIGRDHDMGLMQIIPATWVKWAPKVGVTDPYDPYSNVLVAAAYLDYVRSYAQVRGYPEDYWMLVGYNWGPHNLRLIFEDQKRIPPRQHRYAVDILRAFAAGSRRWEADHTFREAVYSRPQVLIPAAGNYSEAVPLQ